MFACSQLKQSRNIFPESEYLNKLKLRQYPALQDGNICHFLSYPTTSMNYFQDALQEQLKKA